MGSLFIIFGFIHYKPFINPSSPMKNNIKIQIVAAFLACGLLGGMASCSKHDNEAAPTPAAATPTADVHVADGRLVFKDVATYQKTLAELKNKPEQELAAWEAALGYQSVRSLVPTEEEEGGLRHEFGFPDNVATLINAEGEYQIGAKYYWYHAGQKHEFNSAADLAAAKQGKQVAHIILKAGYKAAKPANITTGSRTGKNNVVGADGKYQQAFCLDANCNSRRKIIYETYVYTDDVSSSTFYSALVLAVKLEYRTSSGSWKVAGDNRHIEININGNAESSLVLNQGGIITKTPGCYVPFNIYDIQDRTSNYTITVADCEGFSTNANETNFFWDYTINGRIYSYVTPYQVLAYDVQGNDLW